jgi:hypothetical protein
MGEDGPRCQRAAVEIAARRGLNSLLVEFERMLDQFDAAVRLGADRPPAKAVKCQAPGSGETRAGRFTPITITQ